VAECDELRASKLYHARTKQKIEERTANDPPAAETVAQKSLPDFTPSIESARSSSPSREPGSEYSGEENTRGPSGAVLLQYGQDLCCDPGPDEGYVTTTQSTEGCSPHTFSATAPAEEGDMAVRYSVLAWQ